MDIALLTLVSEVIVSTARLFKENMIRLLNYSQRYKEYTIQGKE